METRDKKTVWMVDFMIQSVVVLPLIVCDVLGLVGILGHLSIAEYLIYGLFLTAPVGGIQLLSAGAGAFWLRTRLHRVYLPVAMLVGGIVFFFLFGGQQINNIIFWILILIAKVMAVFYWLATFALWRIAARSV